MPFYRTPVWRRCVRWGWAIVCIVGFFSCIKGMYSPVLIWLNYPILFAWDVIGKLFYEGNTDQMFGLMPFFFLSLILWWIFLGTVLGTVIYFLFGKESST